PGGRPGRRLWPAAQARPKSRRFGGGRGRKVAHVLVVRRAGRANRPAIDAGAGDGDEETAVEPRIARSARAVAHTLIQLHAQASLTRRPRATGQKRTSSNRRFNQLRGEFDNSSGGLYCVRGFSMWAAGTSTKARDACRNETGTLGWCMRW